MEIMVKEVTNIEEYNVQAQKYAEDPLMYPKPQYIFTRSLVGLPDYDILMYRVLEIGIIEPDKKEIHITTGTANLTCYYSKALHDTLKQIIDFREYIEKIEINKQIKEDTDGKEN